MKRPPRRKPSTPPPLGRGDREQSDADADERQREHGDGAPVELHAASGSAVTITRQGAFLST